ncbi:MAG TPA: class I SAM-dependent methyltransferase [Candidatus Blautia ornithocaccae]|nr:class I SAM-dependent methyltransferase [Candidatus Blautia ornithocaccae]
MRELQISRRLKAVAALVSPGLVLADVGCDHGYIPIYLIQKGQIPRAIAMDINQGPLLRAREHIREWGLEAYIETRLSDGLKALEPGEAQCLVIAGMGGPLMERILTQGAPVLKDMKELILQPQSEIGHFRQFLAENGYRIIEEDMVEEEKKYYPMMKAVQGSMNYTKKAEYLYGKKLLEKRHPVLREFLEKEDRASRELLKKLTQVETSSAEKRKEELQEEIRNREEALAYYEM